MQIASSVLIHDRLLVGGVGGMVLGAGEHLLSGMMM